MTGLISNLLFSSTTYAGVDVTAFESQQPLTGTYDFVFHPDPTSGEDPDIDAFTITANVPEPSSVMALGGLGVLLLGRRRLRS